MTAETAPDAGNLSERARLLYPNLWERRPNHADWLNLRIGLEQVPSTVNVVLPDGGLQPAADLLQHPEQVENLSNGRPGGNGGTVTCLTLFRAR